MSYSAKGHYKNENVATEYNRKRFVGLRAFYVKNKEESFVRDIMSKLSPGQSILDVPVGTGRFSKEFVKYGLKTTGLDISDAMLKQARKAIGESDNLVELKIGDIEKLPYEADTFDMVFVYRLFQHIPIDIKKLICDELFRVTRNYCCISYADTFSFSHVWRTIYHGLIKKEAHPISKGKMIEICKNAGFKVIKIYSLLPLIAGQKVLLLSKQQG